jgi:hypothetical protein
MSELQIIDPDAAHDQWVREHEWHLELVPAIIDALVESTLPQLPVSRGGSRFDKDQITGGGFYDTTPTVHFDYDRYAGILPQGGAADARELWDELLDYLHAAVKVVEKPTRNPPTLASKPDADPLTARGEALITIGWLIDHGEQIAAAATLAKEPDELFRIIRHLRGRYGVFNSPRRRKPEACDICGEYQVRSVWVGSRIGPRSVEVKRCSNCHHEIRGEEPAQGRRQITEIDGKPIQAPGGVSAADREAFAARLAAARKQSEGKNDEQ